MINNALLSSVSFYNAFGCVLVSGLVYALRPKENWLLLYLGAAIAVLLAKTTGRYSETNIITDTVDLTTSIASSGLLVYAGIKLSNSKEYAIEAGLVGLLVAQIISFVLHQSLPSSKEMADLYHAIDAIVSIAAIGVYSVAVCVKTPGLYLRCLAAVGALLWCYGCVEYWTNPATHGLAVLVARISCISGFALTTISSAVLALRQKADGAEHPPTLLLSQLSKSTP